MRLRPGFVYSLFTYHDSVSASIENPSIEVTVYPAWFDKAVLSWKIPSDWGNCSFNVYHGATDTGPFVKLNVIPINGLTFTDLSFRNFSKYHSDYYIVEAILHDKNGALLKSEPSTWDKTMTRWTELRSLEIQRRFWLMLRKFMGSETYVFRRRYFGKHCSKCWDFTNLKVTNDKCPECFGTGWSEGYFEPYQTLVQFEPTPNNVELSMGGRNEPNVIQAVTISFPEINDWDVIYRQKDNRMYRIDGVSTTELLTNVVTQRMQLIELPKNYVEYQLLKRYGI